MCSKANATSSLTAAMTRIRQPGFAILRPVREHDSELFDAWRAFFGTGRTADTRDRDASVSEGDVTVA